MSQVNWTTFASLCLLSNKDSKNFNEVLQWQYSMKYILLAELVHLTNGRLTENVFPLTLTSTLALTLTQ